MPVMFPGCSRQLLHVDGPSIRPTDLLSNPPAFHQGPDLPVYQYCVAAELPLLLLPPLGFLWMFVAQSLHLVTTHSWARQLTSRWHLMSRDSHAFVNNSWNTVTCHTGICCKSFFFNIKYIYLLIINIITIICTVYSSIWSVNCCEFDHLLVYLLVFICLVLLALSALQSVVVVSGPFQHCSCSIVFTLSIASVVSGINCLVMCAVYHVGLQLGVHCPVKCTSIVGV